jgi:hypothetical protein
LELAGKANAEKEFQWVPTSPKGVVEKGDAEVGRFPPIAMGSACELEYHLL